MTSRSSDPDQANKESGWELIKTFLYAVLLAVVFRSFFYEPFHIPSGSMKDTLLVGDYIFVSKMSYGYSRYSFPLGIKFFEGRVFEKHAPQRGDVIVFRLPREPRIDYIKRLIGLPGDTVQVKDSELYINGVKVPRTKMDDFLDNENDRDVSRIPRYSETLPGGKVHDTLDATEFGEVDNTPVYVVPPGKYFMMGDNRDNSVDSRYTEQVGPVPEENLVGQAKLIFFSTDGSAKFWEVWKWIPSLRTDRFFKRIN